MNTESQIVRTQIIQDLDAIYGGMALRCCVELRIADIISNHNRPITLSEIVNGIDSPSMNVDGLERLMRFLVHKKVFNEMPNLGGDEETLYSLNNYSKWLLSDTNSTLAPLVMMHTDPFMVSPLHMLSRSIKEGITAFKITNGEELFDFSLHNSELNAIFNKGMGCTNKFIVDAIVSNYKNGFLVSQGSVVDVGGGTGVAISEIVKAYPHLKGINFDLPHVVSTAPTYEGVTHVAGDMFKSIPPAETIFMKWILHNWSDDDCVKILINCRKAIPKEIGKLIIAEFVQNPPLNNAQVSFDLAMFAYFSGGRERTESEWKKLLKEGGFYRYNIIKILQFYQLLRHFHNKSTG